MSVSGLSFWAQDGRLVSRRGRGRTTERERAALESRVMPSAREVFPVLRERLLGSREVIGHTVETHHADGTVSGGHPIFSAPSFRNVREGGDHL